MFSFDRTSNQADIYSRLVSLLHVERCHGGGMRCWGWRWGQREGCLSERELEIVYLHPRGKISVTVLLVFGTYRCEDQHGSLLLSAGLFMYLCLVMCKETCSVLTMNLAIYQCNLLVAVLRCYKHTRLYIIVMWRFIKISMQFWLKVSF